MTKKLKPAQSLTINTKQVNVICLGNSSGSATATATATATGGKPPYSCLWNTVPLRTTATTSNLKAGPYNITVTDKNGRSALAA